MLRDGDSISDWVEWWLAHAQGQYPALRTYPTTWIAAYIRMVTTLRKNLRTGPLDRLPELSVRLAELALTEPLGPDLQAGAWVILAPHIHLEGRASALAATAALAGELKAAEQVARAALVPKAEPPKEPKSAATKSRKKKHKGMSPDFWSFTHPLSGSFGTGKRR